MNDIETGGPAFPTDNESQNGPNTYHFEGMSLRDYFAAKAMQSILLADGTTRFEQRAKESYEMADAMLKARKGGEA
jgi:hypothetical protein